MASMNITVKTIPATIYVLAEPPVKSRSRLAVLCTPNAADTTLLMTWKKDGLGLSDMARLLLRLPLGFKNLVTDGETDHYNDGKQ